MKYKVSISSGSNDTARAEHAGEGHLEPERKAPSAVARRFPPALQVLTRTDPSVEQQLCAISYQAYQAGLTLKQICGEIYRYAQGLGFEAVIGVQEVYSASMPSFPGQTVISALLMVDLRPLSAEIQHYRTEVGYAC